MEEINFRLANDSDIDKINHFYNSVYKKNRDKLKFDWEFNASPAGKAIYVIAEHNGSIIGTQCVIPYYIITYGNTVILTGKSEDTLVSSDFRGRHVFEKMYTLLISECKRSGIEFIWGFTYAIKPFLKLGFKIPFRSQMGLLVLKPIESATYLSSLSSKNTTFDLLKISALSFASWGKAQVKKAGATSGQISSFENLGLNSRDFNYLKYKNSFGLCLDDRFLKYRIKDNPYNKQYKTCNYFLNGELLSSVTFNITEQGIGYIIHIHISDTITKKELKSFIYAVIRHTDLKHCKVIRFWGFSHNVQNRRELLMLSACGFTFINRGISFVWLSLKNSLDLNPENFVLSRMASQGTD